MIVVVEVGEAHRMIVVVVEEGEAGSLQTELVEV